MASVQKVSFKSETNLLQKMVTQNTTAPANTVVNTTAPAMQADTFSKENPPKKKLAEYIKEYSGIAALALSATAIPVTYAITKKADKKVITKLENNISELTTKIDKLVESNAQLTPEKIAPKKSNLVTILLGIGTALGIGEFVRDNKGKLKEMGYSDDEIEQAHRTSTNIIEGPQAARDIANAANRRAAELEGPVNEAREVAHRALNQTNGINERIDQVNAKANEALNNNNNGIRPEMQKFIQTYYDLNIMRYPNWDKKINNLRTEATMKAIHDAAPMRASRFAKDTIADIKSYKEKYKDSLTSLWSLTAEFKPIKLGGLGDVPVDLQDNFTKLGIDNPTFIPMYETPGVSKFVDTGGSAKYIYNKNTFNLRKIAAMEVEVFKNGTTEHQPVDFYMADNNGKKLVFVRNKNFKGAIYDSTTQSAESEKFAIFNKAVYNLAKTKVAEALGEELSASTFIEKFPAYSELAAPNSMILNDWHAGAMSGLLRYKAPMEYNYNEVNKETFEALKDMPLLMIGHNLKVQGASHYGEATQAGNNNVTQNIINTLYDKYALGILENAHTGINNEDLCNTILLKRTTSDKQFNPLFHGIALSDWFVPVSKNYAEEVVRDAMQSGITKPLLERRHHTGTIGGIINGTDLAKHNMHQVAKNNYVNGLVLKEYDNSNDIEQIMQYREENKRRFYHKFVKPILDGTVDKPELVNPNIGRKDISEEEFMAAPLLSFAHRLTDQKGLVLLKDAIFMLFDNWEKEFGDRPKPFFIVGGPPESAQEVSYLYDLKNPDYGLNKERLDHVFAMKGNMPNPAIMSASTYFCAPSTFEPCGLTQGECFAKGTPVIATNTGGYHDTIEDGVTGFLAPQISSQSVYETIVKALHVYYDNPKQYQQMVKNDLDIDFSWARAGRKGPIYEYTEKLGFNNKKLPDIATAS